MNSQVTVFIGLGGNLDDPVSLFRTALFEMQEHAGIRLTALSSVYRTSPVGYDDQPDFLNAVARIATTLAPIHVLDEMQRIETLLGRVRNGARNGPRKIDLDLLLYGNETVDVPRLTVPHPRLHLRRFALEPLVEIDDNVQIPGHGIAKLVLHDLMAEDGSAANNEAVERVAQAWVEQQVTGSDAESTY